MWSAVTNFILISQTSTTITSHPSYYEDGSGLLMLLKERYLKSSLTMIEILIDISGSSTAQPNMMTAQS